jgi:hypothetical protein
MCICFPLDDAHLTRSIAFAFITIIFSNDFAAELDLERL